jgi:uncharacterized membrane protein
MTEVDPISEAIQNLSRKKHVVTPEARRAKEELDQAKNEIHSQFEAGSLPKRGLASIEEFNKSVRLLTSIFEESNFDELALFVSRPGRVLLINFFIGILRGVGFCVGIVLVLFLLAYFLQTSVSEQAIHEFLKLIRVLNP